MSIRIIARQSPLSQLQVREAMEKFPEIDYQKNLLCLLRHSLTSIATKIAATYVIIANNTIMAAKLIIFRHSCKSSDNEQ